MSRIRELLAHGGIVTLAVVFALALATFQLATAVAREVVSVLQQRAFDEDEGWLSFTIADTEISYAEVLLYTIAFGLVVLALFCVSQLTRRVERVCPECRSQVPVAATVCRYCTSEIQAPGSDA